ncbi:hypothetical protein RJ639_013644 [Escallonia herrerae]|uniref:Uncharacterized protein n=1 Tax=Escallonia herrerae TaxID=1293975 RepID=A0AA88VG82_9ASTE|nr:hypothetical protein RJ639_013644 [Escallonia herrerae]
MAEIVPSDFARPSPAVRLYGSPASSDTSYIRVALLYKLVSLQFIPSQTPPNFGIEASIIQYGSDLISSCQATMLRYVETEFPDPSLMSSWGDETPPLVVRGMMLQHKSVTWHVERLASWVEDMWRRWRKSRGDPVMGSPRIERWFADVEYLDPGKTFVQRSEEIDDPTLQGQYLVRGLYQTFAIATMCVQDQPNLRPVIVDVVMALTYLASQNYDPEAHPVQNLCWTPTTLPRTKREGDKRQNDAGG